MPANDAVCSFLLHQQLPAAEGEVRSEEKNEKTMVQWEKNIRYAKGNTLFWPPFSNSVENLKGEQKLSWNKEWKAEESDSC